MLNGILRTRLSKGEFTDPVAARVAQLRGQLSFDALLRGSGGLTSEIPFSGFYFDSIHSKYRVD